MQLAEKLDRVPRRYRPLLGVASVAIALGAFHPAPKSLVEGIAAAGVAAAGGLGALALSRLKRPRSGSAGQQRVRAIEVEIGGPQEERQHVAASVSELLKERARATSVKYVAISTLLGGLTRNIIVISGADEHQVDVEYEVLRTLLGVAHKGIRIKTVEPELERALAAVVASLNPSGRGEMLPPAPSSEVYIPPPEAVRRDVAIPLGVGFDGAYQKEVYLLKNDIEGHVGIFGSTGTGKTTTLAVLSANSWAQGINVTVLDWAGEVTRVLSSLHAGYRELNPLEDAGINPFAVRELESRPDLVVEVLSRALNLTQPQTFLLSRVVEEEQPSSLEELDRAIERYPEEAKWDRDVKRGLQRKVGLIARPPFSRAFQGSMSLEDLERGFNVIRADLIDSAIARRAYGMMLLAGLFVKRGRKEDLVFAIDEAHNLADEGDLLGSVMAESRKYKLYVAIATQSPASIPNGVLLNANTKIVHALRSLRDKEVIAQSMNLPQFMMERLDKLSAGEAVVQAPSLAAPVLVKVKLEVPGLKGFNNARVGEPVYAYAGVPRA